jgi:hypothetical protein
MPDKFLLGTNIYLLLNEIDQELAETTRQKGCPYCGGKLHLADYPRSPFGLPPQLRDSFEYRLSFCCSQCRKRTTPPSVRFFGRRWFPAPILVFISALRHGVNQYRCEQVKRHFGIVVSESTWRRWRRWWSKSFVTTSFWRQAKGRLPPADQFIQGPFPRVLLNAFQGTIKEKLILLLPFLAPLTAGILRAV